MIYGADKTKVKCCVLKRNESDGRKNNHQILKGNKISM